MDRILFVMGSISDRDVAEKGFRVLDELGLDYRKAVCSAHRDPERLDSLIEEFEEQGGQVIVGIAGQAAHLAGVCAAHSRLPVVGVPVNSKLEGMDALLATVQMPPGMPVATVGIGRGDNAALLAAQILALEDDEVDAAVREYREAKTERNREQSRELNRDE